MVRYDIVSTGIKGIDKAIDNLRLGDNVVWQINSIEEYKYVVGPYVEQAKADKRNIVYIRFGGHDPVIDEIVGVKVYQLYSSLGFEEFATMVHIIIGIEGGRSFYVFDCLTDLQKSWYSDLMTTNFF